MAAVIDIDEAIRARLARRLELEATVMDLAVESVQLTAEVDRLLEMRAAQS